MTSVTADEGPRALTCGDVAVAAGAVAELADAQWSGGPTRAERVRARATYVCLTP